MPSYMNPATSCVDCQISAGKEELQNIHRHHQLFTWEYLLQAWFLLMNGMFLLISQGLVLESIIKLLGCVTIRELTPHPSGSLKNYLSLQNTAIIETHL